MNTQALVESANGKWRGIFSHFNIDVGDGEHRPCPNCGGEDRFRFDDKDGTGSYFCNGCGAGLGLNLLFKTVRIPYNELLSKVSEIVGFCEKDQSREHRKTNPSERLNNLWKSSTPLSGSDPASIYLRNRGLLFRPDCLRYADECYEPDTRKKYPAMLAKVVDVNGKPITIHRTYIMRDGKKADIEHPKKLMPGTQKITGGAIRLFPATDYVGVAEGIETAISCMQIFNVPTWATISSTLMEAFTPPDGIRKITVFADNDANFAGVKSAYALANKLYLNDFIVDVIVPDICGDFNDVLQTEKPK